MHLEPWAWILACCGAFLIGLSKTGIAGIGLLAITLFSNVLPGKGSVGLVLLLLICADVVAVAAFRRHADWKHLIRLFPWTITGVVLGYVAMGRVDDQQIRHLLGAILLVLVSLQVWQFFKKKPASDASEKKHHPLYAPVMGLAAGFTTMVANAAGPIMILYLLASNLSKLAFVGTGAWFFLLINLFKVPFSWSLGLITPASMGVDLVLAPFAVLGALSGRALLPHINQRVFEGTALGLTFLASLKLLLG
jgi:uncharacterized membrane protein YfcA